MKKLITSNYRVVVDVAEPWMLGKKTDEEIHKYWMTAANDLQAQIKRHVDGIGGISIEYDQDHFCEHCYAVWSSDSDVFNGGCCDKDMENEPPMNEDDV